VNVAKPKRIHRVEPLKDPGPGEAAAREAAGPAARPGEGGTGIEPQPSEVAPDFVEPLEAWRVWRVLQTDAVLTLASVVKGVAWSPGEALVAECLGPRLIPLPRLGRAANAASTRPTSPTRRAT
jgi:hypothetical protein